MGWGSMRWVGWGPMGGAVEGTQRVRVSEESGGGGGGYNSGGFGGGGGKKGGCFKCGLDGHWASNCPNVGGGGGGGYGGRYGGGSSGGYRR